MFKEEYRFSEYFWRKDLPSLKHLLLKALRKANKDQTKLVNKSLKIAKEGETNANRR